MKLKPFQLELFFAKYEFTCPYLLCASDCESLSIDELLMLSGTSRDTLLQAKLGYTESQGDEALRASIADTTPGVSTDEVIFLSAPEEGIYIALNALLSPGDHVIVLSPIYESLLNLAEEITGNVSLWKFQQNNGAWSLDENELYRLITPKTKCLILNFPHNPTGFLPDENTLKRILNWAAAQGITVFSDEMYRGLEMDPQTRLPSAVELNQQTIVLSGLSKTYGLPGLRAGWLIVKDAALRAEMLNWKLYTSICASKPSEILTQAALNCREKLASRNRDIIANNIAAAAPFFERWQSLFTWSPPHAGSVALIEVQQPSASEFCETLAKAGFLLLPSRYMNFGDQHVRFGFGRLSFLTNLQALEKYLDDHF
jgi:aspartate/methionine/tyrosine aminotransferase